MLGWKLRSASLLDKFLTNWATSHPLDLYSFETIFSLAILKCNVFICHTFKLLLFYFLACAVSNDNVAIILTFCYSAHNVFYLPPEDLSLSLVLSSLVIVCISMVFFMRLLLGVCWTWLLLYLGNIQLLCYQVFASVFTSLWSPLRMSHTCHWTWEDISWMADSLPTFKELTFCFICNGFHCHAFSFTGPIQCTYHLRIFKSLNFRIFCCPSQILTHFTVSF